MDPFEAGTDMITIADDAPVERGSPSRIYTRAKRYEPQRMLIGSGRASIRDSIRDMMNAVRDKAEEYGIRRVVESLNEEQTQALWKADDVAWFWLATGESNARPLGQHDIIRMHTATLRRMLDNESFESAKEQMDLTEIPHDPKRNVLYEQWARERSPTDIVWEYIKSHLPGANAPAIKPGGAYYNRDKRYDNDFDSDYNVNGNKKKRDGDNDFDADYTMGVVKKGAKYNNNNDNNNNNNGGKKYNNDEKEPFHMVLNSMTMYAYMVAMNPSAYGTHVRTLLSGAYQYALTHALIVQSLGMDADTYVDTHITRAHRPYVRDVLSREKVMSAVLDFNAAEKDTPDYRNSKIALIRALESTRLAREVKSSLERNTMDTESETPFKNLFGMYKALVILLAMVKLIQVDTHGAVKARSAGLLVYKPPPPPGSNPDQEFEKATDVVALLGRWDMRTMHDRELLHNYAPKLGAKILKALRKLIAANKKMAKYDTIIAGPGESRATAIQKRNAAKIGCTVMFAGTKYAMRVQYMYLLATECDKANEHENKSELARSARFAIGADAAMRAYKTTSAELKRKYVVCARDIGRKAPSNEHVAHFNATALAHIPALFDTYYELLESSHPSKRHADFPMAFGAPDRGADGRVIPGGRVITNDELRALEREKPIAYMASQVAAHRERKEQGKAKRDKLAGLINKAVQRDRKYTDFERNRPDSRYVELSGVEKGLKDSANFESIASTLDEPVKRSRDLAEEATRFVRATSAPKVDAETSTVSPTTDGMSMNPIDTSSKRRGGWFHMPTRKRKVLSIHAIEKSRSGLGGRRGVGFRDGSTVWTYSTPSSPVLSETSDLSLGGGDKGPIPDDTKVAKEAKAEDRVGEVYDSALKRLDEMISDAIGGHSGAHYGLTVIRDMIKKAKESAEIVKCNQDGLDTFKAAFAEDDDKEKAKATTKANAAKTDVFWFLKTAMYHIRSFCENEPRVLKISFGDTLDQTHSRTQTTIKMLRVFFLTGIYRTLDVLDDRVKLVLFPLDVETDARSVTKRNDAADDLTGYEMQADELRDTLLRYIQMLRKEVLLTTAVEEYEGANRISTEDVASMLIRRTKALIRTVQMHLHALPEGIVFVAAQNASQNKSSKDDRKQWPTGAALSLKPILDDVDEDDWYGRSSEIVSELNEKNWTLKADYDIKGTYVPDEINTGRVMYDSSKNGAMQNVEAVTHNDYKVKPNDHRRRTVPRK